MLGLNLFIFNSYWYEILRYVKTEEETSETL